MGTRQSRDSLKRGLRTAEEALDEERSAIAQRAVRAIVFRIRVWPRLNINEK